MKLRRIVLCLFYLLVLLFSAGAEPFKANERVAFVGDSITHGGSYHTLIQTFYATRFPGSNVACFNVGVSGDTAEGGALRASGEGGGIWENDVKLYRPTAATVMLGMNDAGSWHFTHSKSEDELTAENERRFEWYKNSYSALLDNLASAGLTHITLIKPSAYDQTMVNPNARENLVAFGCGKNDLLVRFGNEVIEPEAEKRGYPVCDFNTPLLAINAEQQKADPAFSIIGTDRVHPGQEGHTVMAYEFLKFQQLEGPVAEIEIDAAASKPLNLMNCEIRALKADGLSAEFVYAANSLPFPRRAYEAANQWVPIEKEFNRETLTVTGLKPAYCPAAVSGRWL